VLLIQTSGLGKLLNFVEDLPSIIAYEQVAYKKMRCIYKCILQ